MTNEGVGTVELGGSTLDFSPEAVFAGWALRRVDRNPSPARRTPELPLFLQEKRFCTAGSDFVEILNRTYAVPLAISLIEVGEPLTRINLALEAELNLFAAQQFARPLQESAVLVADSAAGTTRSSGRGKGLLPAQKT